MHLRIIIVFGVFLYLINSSAMQLVPFLFSTESGKWGYKEKGTDNVIIYWQFDEATEFNQRGRARVRINNKYSIIDTNGHILLPLLRQSVPWNFNSDTILMTNTKNSERLIFNYSSNEYFMYYENEYVSYDLTNTAYYKITIFIYPRDNEIVKQLIFEQRQKDLNYNKEWQTSTYLSISSNVIHRNNLANSDRIVNNVQVNTQKQFVDFDVFKMGMSASISQSIYIRNTTLKSRYLSIGTFVGFKISNSWQMNFTFQPVIVGKMWAQDSIKTTWAEFTKYNKKINAEISFDNQLFFYEKCYLNAGIRRTPNLSSLQGLYENFIYFGIGYKW